MKKLLFTLCLLAPLMAFGQQQVAPEIRLMQTNGMLPIQRAAVLRLRKVLVDNGATIVRTNRSVRFDLGRCSDFQAIAHLDQRSYARFITNANGAMLVMTVSTNAAGKREPVLNMVIGPSPARDVSSDNWRAFLIAINQFNNR